MKSKLASLAGFFALASTFHSPASAAEQPPKPPNIIFLLTDDQRADTLGAAGNPFVITPALDKLAAEGSYFKNSFVVTSICAPNRACILSGLYPRTTRIKGFAEGFTDKEFQETYPALLRSAGYFTGFIGKWGVGANLNSYVDHIGTNFDYWKGVYDQGEYWPEGKKGRHFTKIMTSQAAEFLDKIPKDKPFCLSMSYKAPHGAWSEVDPECFALYKDVNIPLPKTLTEEDIAKFPAKVRTEHLTLPGKSAEELRSIFELLARQYYGLITGIDQSVGEIRSILKDKGLADNTVIIFTSDNGHFLFEYGMHGKWLMLEPSLRVPLVIYDPRITPADRAKIVDAFALSVDMAPTVLDFAGLKAPKAMQGRSLVPLVHGKVPEDWRKDMYYEYNFGMFPGDIPASIGVRDSRWKYIRYLDPRGEFEQLFDLKNDPGEADDLIKNPACAAELERLRARLETYRAQIPDNLHDPMENPGKYHIVPTAYSLPETGKPLDFAKEKTIGQTFVADGDFLHAITWMFPYQMKKCAPTDLLVDVRRGGPDGEVLASAVIPPEHSFSLYPCAATFDVPVKKGEILYVEMHPKVPVAPREILLWAYPKNVFAGGQAFLDRKPTDIDIPLNFIYQKH